MSQFPNSYPANGSQGSTRLVIVALVIAALAVVLVNVYITMVRSQARGGEFEIYRLQRSVQPGDTFSRRDIERVVVDNRFKDGFLGAMNSTDLESALGKTFQRSAPLHAPLTHDLFIIPEGGEFDRQITTGRRAVALPINPRTVPAHVRPGVFVDIEAPFARPGGGTEILPVMERVRVMALGDLTIGGDTTERGRSSRMDTITIELSPEEATQMSNIKSRVVGDFELYLRNPRDPGEPKIELGGINPVVLERIQQAPATADRFGAP